MPWERPALAIPILSWPHFFSFDCFFEFVAIRAYVACLVIFICDSFTSVLTMVKMNAVLYSYYYTSPIATSLQLHKLQSTPTI